MHFRVEPGTDKFSVEHQVYKAKSVTVGGKEHTAIEVPEHIGAILKKQGFLQIFPEGLKEAPQPQEPLAPPQGETAQEGEEQEQKEDAAPPTLEDMGFKDLGEMCEKLGIDPKPLTSNKARREAIVAKQAEQAAAGAEGQAQKPGEGQQGG